MALSSKLIFTSRASTWRSFVTTSGLISTMVASRSRKARYAPRMIVTAWLTCAGLRPSPNASSRAWNARMPTAGSTTSRRMAAGPRMDLGLDDPAAGADLGRSIDGLVRAVRHASLGHRHAETGEQLFRLVFVDVHELRSRGGHGGSRRPVRGDRGGDLHDVLR